MNEVTVGRRPSCGLSAQDMVQGQYGVVTDQMYRDEVIFCTYNGFVNLRTGETWRADCKLAVTILEPGETVNIEIG